MPRSFLIKKKSDRDEENPTERSQQQPEPNCDDQDGGDGTEMMYRPWPSPHDPAALRRGKQEPEVDDATSLVAVSRRTTIWSPAAELHVDNGGKKSTANVSPTSGLTPFTPLSAAAAAAFLHPKGNYSPVYIDIPFSSAHIFP